MKQFLDIIEYNLQYGTPHQQRVARELLLRFLESDKT